MPYGVRFAECVHDCVHEVAIFTQAMALLRELAIQKVFASFFITQYVVFTVIPVGNVQFVVKYTESQVASQ